MSEKEENSRIADLERQISVLKKTKDPNYEKVLNLLCQQITVLMHDEYYLEDEKSDLERSYKNISNRTNNFLIMNDFEPLFFKNGDEILDDSEVFVTDLIKTNKKELDGKVFRTNIFGLKKNGKVLKPAQITKYEYVESNQDVAQKLSLSLINFEIIFLAVLFAILCFAQGLSFSNSLLTASFLSLFSISFIKNEKERIFRNEKIHKINYVITSILVLCGVVYSIIFFNLTAVVEGSLIIILMLYLLISRQQHLLNESKLRAILKNKYSICVFALLVYFIDLIGISIARANLNWLEIIPNIFLLLLAVSLAGFLVLKNRQNSDVEKITKIIYIIVIYLLTLLTYGFHFSVLAITIVLLIMSFFSLFISKIRRNK